LGVSKRKTTAEFIEGARKIHGDKYDYSEVVYVGKASRVKIICREHGVFEQIAGHHTRGSGCQVCGRESKTGLNSSKLVRAASEFVSRAREVHGDLYDYSEAFYSGSKSEMKIKCKKHGAFDQTPGSHLSGRGCPRCQYINAASLVVSRYAREFESRARAVHGNTYDYSDVAYTSSSAKVKIKCKEHGFFEQSPSSHLAGRGCQACCGRESTNKTFARKSKMSGSEFVSRAREIHGDLYDYSDTVYAGSRSRVRIACKKHGIFEQYPQYHLAGSGCQVCGRESTNKTFARKSKKAGSEFVSRAREIHGDLYDYSGTVYAGSKSDVNIACKKHGVFKQSPASHIHGHGCPQCGIESRAKLSTKSTAEFISSAIKVHGDRYDYSVTVYTNASSKVSIICKEHGYFEQIPNSHLNGYGCSRCSSSRMESIAGCSLDDLGIDFMYNVTLFNRKRFDVVIASLSQLWEFDGEQHFKPIGYWGGEDALSACINRDAEKTRWAVENDWTLIRVPYWDRDNIESYIREYASAPPPPGLIITSHTNGTHSYDKMLELANVPYLPCMA
jgi:formate dehydrogenase assembly factor FdhD